MIFRGGRLDEALDDVRTALDHFRARGERAHGLDPARISLVGLSAGGTLAMLTAGCAEGEIHRLACAFGLYELDHLEGGLARIVPRLLFRTPDRAVWSARSPRGATQPRVPTLLVHGTADGLVPVAQSQRLAAHRESLGLPTRLVLYPDAPHGFFHFHSAATHEAAAEIVAHVAAK
jgi:acetyl esterase/lipase